MKKLLLIVLFLILGCSQRSEDKNALANKRPLLTIDRILSKPSITGTYPSSPSWSADSRQLAFLWNDSGLSRREIWVVSGDGSGLRQLTSEVKSEGGVKMFVWTPNSEDLIYLRSGDLWQISLENSERKRLTDSGGNKSNLKVSPNGRYASYLARWRPLDLFNLVTGTLSQQTKVGVPSISEVPLGRYNRPDVEIGSYVWGGPTYAWSPDSRTIAVHYVDRRNMRKVPFPHYLGKETIANNVRRGYPGDPNEYRTIGFLSVESGDLNLLDLPSPTANRIAGFSWSSQWKTAA
ncbi:MAG: hypothetical protein ACJZ15_00735 [Candidatus Neomarinimicrobiota bacterium]